MNSTEKNDHFSVFDSSIEQFYDMATDMEKKGRKTIFNELTSAYQRYWITKEIAEGGAKKILKVKDATTNRHVAMALLKESGGEDDVEDFLREARLTAYLQHPNIMPVYDIGVNSNQDPYFTMKLIKGGYNLSSLAKSANQISKFKTLTSRLEVLLKICDGMAFAHSKGILHLDLKPENIQLDNFGQVLICDWGLARFTTGQDTDTMTGTDKINSMDFLNVTVKGMVQGTPGFMAPEQSTPEKCLKDEKTDIYALGALLYYLLSFHSPLKRGTVKQMLADTVNGKIVPLSHWQKKHQIADSLVKVCEKAMHVDPDKRYNSVEELQSEIRAYMEGYATLAENAGFFTQLTLFYHRNKRILNLILFSVVVIVSFAFYSMQRMKVSEKRALESENQALQNLAKLKKEKKEKRELGMIASKQLVPEAIALYYSYSYSEAYAMLNLALEVNPKNARAWYYLGWLSITAQRFDDATKYFKQASKYSDLELINGYIKKFTPVIEELRELVNPETNRLDEKVLNDYISKQSKGKYPIFHKHILYRHKNNLLKNE